MARSEWKNQQTSFVKFVPTKYQCHVIGVNESQFILLYFFLFFFFAKYSVFPDWCERTAHTPWVGLQVDSALWLSDADEWSNLPGLWRSVDSRVFINLVNCQGSAIEFQALEIIDDKHKYHSFTSHCTGICSTSCSFLSISVFLGFQDILGQCQIKFLGAVVFLRWFHEWQ